MVNVIINEDCSNAPIKDFFKNIIIEGLHGNLDFINNILK